jgi:endo-1,4-beta-mannosidase
MYKERGVLLIGSSFKFLLGVNYWPRKLNIRMWRDWDEKAVEEDVRLMKSLGIRAVRFFIKDEDFADESADVYPYALERLRKFLDMLNENGIVGFVSLIVGHMSGKNWRIPWTRFEDLYRSDSIEKTMRFVERVVREFKDHPAIAGWILSNEMSLVKKAVSREEALALLRAFSRTVKSIDRDHVVSSGDIPDSYLQETPNVRDYVDYVGPHLYLYDTDSIRHGYTYGAMLELFSNDGDIPVILEEFGFSTYQYSEENHAKFVNEVLYTALAHNASGAFIWCFSDFMHESDPPYEWRPLELGFGIVRKDGSLKPVAEVVKRFAKEVEDIEKLGIHRDFRRVPETSIIIPFYIFKDYEFVRYRDVLGFWRSIQPLLTASILLSSAGIDNTMVYEIDVEKTFKTRKLLVSPSTIVALSSTWRKLLNYVESGGNIYTSLVKGLGEFKALHEASTHLWTELMGLENTLEAGSMGIKYCGRVGVRFVRDFGIIRNGEEIEINIPIPIYTYRARSVDAEVLAVDSNGNPVLFRARRGGGRVYTMLLPVELIQAVAEYMDWGGGVQKIFRSLALETGIDIRYNASSAEVEVKAFYGQQADIVIAVNHGEDKRVIISCSKPLKNVMKIGGDASIATWSSTQVTADMPKKSGLVFYVKH